MGVEVTALIPHTLAPDEVLQIPAALNASKDVAKSSWQLERTWFRRRIDNRFKEKWKAVVPKLTPERLIDHWEAGDSIPFSGACTSMYVTRSVVELMMYMFRWESFLLNAEVQQSVRNFVTAIATTLNNSHFGPMQAIYLPDSAYDVSGALDECSNGWRAVGAWLNSNHGPSAPTIESISTEQDDSDCANGYFCDELSGNVNH